MTQNGRSILPPTQPHRCLSLEPKKGKISIELSKTNNVSSMRFGWSENVPAAVFTRAGYLWVVFDQEVSLDVSKLKSESLQIISLPQQIDSDKGNRIQSKIS